MPWAKLQAVPVALALGLWVLAAVRRRPGGCACRAGLPGRAARRRGPCCRARLLVAWVRSAGAWDQFWHSYILANLSRAGDKPWPIHVQDAIRLFFRQEGSSWFLSAAPSSP